MDNPETREIWDKGTKFTAFFLFKLRLYDIKIIKQIKTVRYQTSQKHLISKQKTHGTANFKSSLKCRRWREEIIDILSSKNVYIMWSKYCVQSKWNTE